MRVRNNRVLRDNSVTYCSEFLDRPLFWDIGFSHRENKGVAGTSARDNKALSLVILYDGLDALKNSL